MGLKGITIYTPPDAGPHVYAEDDAQLHRALLGGSGITFADDQLACTVVNNNTVRLAAGAYTMQGYIIVVQGGTVADLTVDSGSAGAYRHDLVVADFIRGGGAVADQFTFHVVKGTNAASAQNAEDPALIQDDLTAGGSQRQEALYRLIINETAIVGVERIAQLITQMNAEIDAAPTAGSGNAVASGGAYTAINAARPRYATLVIPVDGWTGSGAVYTFVYTAEDISNTTMVRASSANQATADAMPEVIIVTPGAGRLTFTTSKRPTGVLTVALDLQESSGVTGSTCIAAGAGGGKPYDDWESVVPVQGYFTALRQPINMLAQFGDVVVLMLDLTYGTRYVGEFATIPPGFRPAADVYSAAAVTTNGTAQSTEDLYIYATGLLRLPNVESDSLQILARYQRSDLPENQWRLRVDPAVLKNAVIAENLITRDPATGAVRIQFAATFDAIQMSAVQQPLGLYAPYGLGPDAAQQFTATATINGTPDRSLACAMIAQAYYRDTMLAMQSYLAGVTAIAFDFTINP